MISTNFVLRFRFLQAATLLSMMECSGGEVRKILSEGIVDVERLSII